MSKVEQVDGCAEFVYQITEDKSHSAYVLFHLLKLLGAVAGTVPHDATIDVESLKVVCSHGRSLIQDVFPEFK